MSTTKKTTQKPKTAALPAKKEAPNLAPPTAQDLHNEFMEILTTATSWCADHCAHPFLKPQEAFLLGRTADMVEDAMHAAGGPENVPTAVLAYMQILRDAEALLLAHGIKRSIKVVLRGMER